MNTKTVSPDLLHSRFNSGDHNVLIDVRSVPEYRGGHPRNAVNIPLDDIAQIDLETRTGIKGIGKEVPAYITCKSGLRAEQAAEKLQLSGYHNLMLLDGGIDAWEKAGLPMRRIENAIPLEGQVQITLGTLLILKVFFGFTVNELFFVLGALMGAGLIVAGFTRWCGMAKLLAFMPWNRTSQPVNKSVNQSTS
jgi:rhodanese-related sulfurtransferase